MNPRKFEPGWPGMNYDVIPGRADCETCRNTGYRIMHGAPRDGRTGMQRFDYPCECGRDPIQFLHDEVVRKASSASEILATVIQPVAGKFCSFDIGEIVKVDWDDGVTCAIQRRKWKGALVPIANCLAGVPRYLLRFETAA